MLNGVYEKFADALQQAIGGAGAVKVWPPAASLETLPRPFHSAAPPPHLTAVLACRGVQVLDVASANGEPAVTVAKALPQAAVVSRGGAPYPQRSSASLTAFSLPCEAARWCCGALAVTHSSARSQSLLCSLPLLPGFH